MRQIVGKADSMRKRWVDLVKWWWEHYSKGPRNPWLNFAAYVHVEIIICSPSLRYSLLHCHLHREEACRLWRTSNQCSCYSSTNIPAQDRCAGTSPNGALWRRSASVLARAALTTGCPCDLFACAPYSCILLNSVFPIHPVCPESGLRNHGRARRQLRRA